MSDCNCNRCGLSTCTNQCVCTEPNYDSLGCLGDKKTSCMLYDGDDIPELGITKNMDLNIVILKLKEALVALM